MARSRRPLAGALGLGLAAIVGTGSAGAFSQEPAQQSGAIDPSRDPFGAQHASTRCRKAPWRGTRSSQLDVRTEVVGPLRAHLPHRLQHRDQGARRPGRQADGLPLPARGRPRARPLPAHRLAAVLPVLPAGGADRRWSRCYCAEPIDVHRQRDPGRRHGSSSCTTTRPACTTACTTPTLVERFDDVRWTGRCPAPAGPNATIPLPGSSERRRRSRAAWRRSRPRAAPALKQ